MLTLNSNNGDKNMSIMKEEIEKILVKIENIINTEIEKKNYDFALSQISICANILYQTNICYVDVGLEHALERIARELEFNKFVKTKEDLDDDIVLFWDGFGLNDRGLAQIYIKALCKFKKVIYVTYADRKDNIPDILDILSKYHAEKIFVNRSQKSIVARIQQLNSFLEKTKPGHVFFYSTPDDVVATPLMFAYKGLIVRYQINLTDHAFWLGASCIDQCIEFRDYGAKISKEYRGINEKQIRVIPFYPMVHYGRKFEGYPFAVKDDQKVIFSGGALYKTIGADNKYYEMLEYILKKYPNVIFWYAGSGNTIELEKIIKKYPDRVYFTEERSDLFQILKHCDMYLSTYPMCGGLMIQYAAMAGKVPVTLKYNEISDGFLLNQHDKQIEFTDLKDLYAEVDKLLTDKSYSQKRGNLMKKSVIDPEVFEEEVRKIVFGEESNQYRVRYEHIDTQKFRDWYLDKMTIAEFNAMLIRKHNIKFVIKYFPFRFLRGGIYLIRKKISI